LGDSAAGFGCSGAAGGFGLVSSAMVPSVLVSGTLSYSSYNNLQGGAAVTAIRDFCHNALP
jgi:hypothetical protein